MRRQPLPYTDIRWIVNEPGTVDIPGLSLTRDTLRVEDMRGGKLLLFTSPWNIDWATDHNKELKLSEFGDVEFWPKQLNFRRIARQPGGATEVFRSRPLLFCRRWARYVDARGGPSCTGAACGDGAL